MYFDPADGGRAHLHPWDHDNAFYRGDYITAPLGNLAVCCKRDEECHALFHEALERVGHAVGALYLLGEASDTADLINPYLATDPRREYSMASVEDEQAALLFWLQVRSNVLGNVPTL